MEPLAAGLALGLGSGVAPGPLLALVISTALQRGARAGAQVAMAPVVTDLPIILLSLTVLRIIPPAAVAGLAVIGAVVVAWFAVESLRAARTANLALLAEQAPAAGLAPLRRGALVNWLSPAPWLFWTTVGGPLVIAAWARSPGGALAWLLGFYAALVGAKVLLAIGVAAGRHRLSTRGYRTVLAGSGVLLLVVAALLAREALTALG